MELITKEKKGFKKTEVGWIPKEWNIELLVNLSTITRLAGAEYSSVWEEDKFGEIIALRGFNIGQNQIIERDFVRISDSLSKQLKRSRLKKGDIVYPCVGSIGNATVIHESDKYHIQQNIARIIPTKKIDSTYIAYYLMSPIGLNEIDRFNATSSQPNVLVGSLRQYRVPIPPTLEEQQAIASALSDVDELIRSLDRLIEKKEAIKKGTMQQLLSGKKRLPGFDGEWEVKTLEEISDCLDNLRVPLNESQRNQMRGNIPYCGANGILDHVNDYVIDDDIILMAEDGGYFDEYKTRPIAYRMKGKCWVNNHAHILKAKGFYNQSFLFYSLVHKDIQDYITGGTRAKLNKGNMLKIEVYSPNEKEEQKAIAQILSDMDRELDTLRQKREKMRRIKEGMMQELLTGKTRLV